MPNGCKICQRPFDDWPPIWKKNNDIYCSNYCKTFYKKHLCSGIGLLGCKIWIKNSENFFCSDECKKFFFFSKKKTKNNKKCSKCYKIINFSKFRIRNFGWKDSIGLRRLSYCRDCENNYQKEKRDQRPAKRLFLLAKRRALKEKLKFNLTIEYIEQIWPKNNQCPIFETVFKSGIQNRNFLPTIDKIKPANGYTIGNIVIISFKANQIKSDVYDINIFKKLYDFYKTNNTRD